MIETRQGTKLLPLHCVDQETLIVKTNIQRLVQEKVSQFFWKPAHHSVLGQEKKCDQCPKKSTALWTALPSTPLASSRGCHVVVFVLLAYTSKAPGTPRIVFSPEGIHPVSSLVFEGLLVSGCTFKQTIRPFFVFKSTQSSRITDITLLKTEPQPLNLVAGVTMPRSEHARNQAVCSFSALGNQ